MIRKYDPVLNINTGTVSPRTTVTDENPIIFRRIDAETAHAIMSGKVSASAVIDAIDTKERSSPDFNWREYDKKRRAGEKMLNVSQREMIPVSDVPNEEGVNVQNDENVISLKDLGIGEKDSVKAPTKSSTKKTSKADDSVKSEKAASENGDSSNGLGLNL